VSETLESLRVKRERAHDLASVVGTMKALAASSIGQYESAVHSLEDYFRTVELGLVACFKGNGRLSIEPYTTDSGKVGAVVFGSDQGLVGRFNLSLSEDVARSLGEVPGETEVWAVGERIAGNLLDEGVNVVKVFSVPNSVQGIAPLVSEILVQGLARTVEEKHSQVLSFHNQATEFGRYQSKVRHLLPLDTRWIRQFAAQDWPTRLPPEVVGGSASLLPKLVREYLFVSLYRACAESLMSENRTRLNSMQRAEKNIEERLEQLTSDFHRLRQSAIDNELFDLIAGYEALHRKKRRE